MVTEPHTPEYSASLINIFSHFLIQISYISHFHKLPTFFPTSKFSAVNPSFYLSWTSWAIQRISISFHWHLHYLHQWPIWYSNLSTIISQEFFKLLDNAVPPLIYSIHPSCQQYFPLSPESFIFFLFTCSFSSVWKHAASLAHTKTKNKKPLNYYLSSKYYPFLSLFSRVGCTHCRPFLSSHLLWVTYCIWFTSHFFSI